MSKIYNNLSYYNARKFLESIDNENTSIYVFIGRPTEWDNDDDPPDLDNTTESINKIWNDITALKRVTKQDVRLGFRRINWISNTVYDEYDHRENLSDKDFYVFVEENRNVYKCISNNNSGVSLNQPDHIEIDPKKYDDGYVWKYMFTLSNSLIRKFSTENYLPIENDQIVISSSIPGSINQLKIINPGGGYQTNQDSIKIFIWGDGDLNDSGRAKIFTQGGRITQILSITDSGEGYPTPPESDIPVLFRQVNDLGILNETAFGLINTNTDGEIIEVKIVIQGTEYLPNKEISIVFSSCTGIGQTNEDGEIIDAQIYKKYPGRNFTKAKTKVIAITNNLSNQAVIEPIISPLGGHGAFPEKELFANKALINIRVAYREGGGDFTVDNDFRRVGLIENPYDFGTKNISKELTLDAKKKLSLKEISGTFKEDDKFYGKSNGAEGIMVDLIDYNQVTRRGNLRYIMDEKSINSLPFLKEDDIISEENAVAKIDEIINPEVELYSGDILFVKNRQPVKRSNKQIESITLVLEY
jgi:hypothetical protein